MTYVTKRRYPGRRAMAGLLDPITDQIPVPSDQQRCIDQANQDLAPFDAKIDDLAKNWSPTGFYTPTDIRDIVTATMQVVAQGYDALSSAAAEPNASGDSISRATSDLRTAGSRSLDYLNAATAVEQQGLQAVNAPGFKRWVTDTLASVSSAMVTSEVIGCLRPWWVNALAAFQSAFDTVYAVAKRIVGVVMKVGDIALKVPDAVDDMLTIIKWGVGLGGAALILHKLGLFGHVRRPLL